MQADLGAELRRVLRVVGAVPTDAICLSTASASASLPLRTKASATAEVKEA